MKTIGKLMGVVVLTLLFGFITIGCATRWDGAVYTLPPQPIFNNENVAKGEFFTLNSVYRVASNNIDGLCFIVNLGSFNMRQGVTRYDMIFSEFSTGPNANRGISLYQSFVQERDISILSPGQHTVGLLENSQLIGTNTTNEEFIAGRNYYLYNDVNNRPMIYNLSNEGSLQWGGMEISKSAVIEGLNAFLALEFGWRMEAAPAPPLDTLERRSYNIRDREAAAIGRYCTRSINSGEIVRDTNSNEWFILTNNALPGETFYIFIKKGFFSPIEVYRKIN
ncbi:MAG: hypothetical protein FWB83_04800 [Treponema sp.]|nr:hypothetical protein [Treponema sp.]